MNLANSNILVTGGSDGYGRGIAAALARAGARVTVTGRNKAKLDALAQELGELVKTILEMPDHHAVPVLVVQPMVQDICPM